MKFLTLGTWFILLAASSLAAADVGQPDQKTVSAASTKPVYRCFYDDKPYCIVDLLSATKDKPFRKIDVDDHYLTVTAAFGQLVPINAATGDAGDSAPDGANLPLSPDLKSDLTIVKVKYQSSAGHLEYGFTKFDDGKKSFDGCIKGATSTTGRYFPPSDNDRRLHIDSSETNFSKINNCDFVVTSVTVFLPAGSKPPTDYLIKKIQSAGQSLAAVLIDAKKNLDHLEEVLPLKRRPLAEAYKKSIDDLLTALKVDGQGQVHEYVSSNSVMEAARNLYVHGSVLEAVLLKNKNDLTAKYIDFVTGAVDQISTAFGFNDASNNLNPVATQETKILGGPLSRGYAALMTAVDIALQDIVASPPLDPNSQEMRLVYDMQATAQTIRAVVYVNGDTAARDMMDRFAQSWNDSKFQTVLKVISDMRGDANTSGTSNLNSALNLLVIARKDLVSFSDLDFNLPFPVGGDVQ